MANRRSTWLIVLFVGILLTACLSAPPTQFYVLESLSVPPPFTPTTEKKRQVGIGPISIPAMLERKQIVTRLADNNVTIAEFHQWASPLKDNVAQVLTHNLATLQAGDLIRAYPWSAYGAVDYRIVIDITRFDARSDQTVNLEANWAILNEKNHTLLSNGRTKIEHPLDDPSYPSTVKALNKALSEFSLELAQALGKMK